MKVGYNMSNSFKVFQDKKGDIFYLTEQYLEMIGIENKNSLKVGNYLIKDISNNLFFKDYNDCVDFKIIIIKMFI
jgi:hypothetical protein